MTTQDGSYSEFPNRIDSNSQHGARARECKPLASLGDALAAAGVELAAPTARAKIIASRYWRRLHRARGVTTPDTADKLQPAIELAAGALQLSGQALGDAVAWRAVDYALFMDERGTFDTTLARACAAKLARRMRAKGKHVSPQTEADGAAAGVLALARWQSTGTNQDGQPEAETQTARVAWRAVVAEISRDTFGDSIALHTVGDDWLYANAQPCESRAERAARLRVERAALGYTLPDEVTIGGKRVGSEVVTLPKGMKVSSRFALLAKRFANLPGGPGRRAQAINRVSNATAMLLTGMRLDEAATAAGFNPRSNGQFTHSAGDAFCQALRRLGFRILAHARQRDSKPQNQSRRAFSPEDYGAFNEQIKPLAPEQAGAVLGVSFANQKAAL